MIGLTFYTADETGCENASAHQHEIDIMLEKYCVGGLCEFEFLDFSKYKRYHTIDENCPVCKGTGFIPSENGLKILDFVNKYSGGTTLEPSKQNS